MTKILSSVAALLLIASPSFVKKVGKLLDRLVDAGANRGMQISFGMDNPEELLDQARLAAVLDARKKAELYVKGAGGSLGPVLTIVEGNLQPYQQFRYEHLASPGAGDSTLQIAAGQQELHLDPAVRNGRAENCDCATAPLAGIFPRLVIPPP